jgi:polyhydroxyalkanoate synthesis regulator phasin
MGVATRTVEMAKEVKAKAPDLFQKMKTGEMRTGTAHRLMKERSRPAQPPTRPDPDRAAASIQDVKDDLEADGATPLARDILTRLAKCSATELTWLRSEVLYMFGIREG